MREKVVLIKKLILIVIVLRIVKVKNIRSKKFLTFLPIKTYY